MTVQTSTTVATGIGNGVTTVFPIGFKFNRDEDLLVILIDSVTEEITQLALNSDYTVQGAGNEEGGSVTVTVAVPEGKSIRTIRSVDLLQLTDLRNQGKFFAEVHEDTFDLIVMMIQQQQEQLDRSVKVSIGSDTPADELLAEFKADIAQADAAAELSVEAKNESQAIAEQFGDVAGAISAAEDARDGAAGSAGLASASAVSAQLSADLAETAASTSFVSADVYGTVAEGLGAVLDGEQFQVVTGDLSVRYERESASVALRVADYPNGGILPIVKQSADALNGYVIDDEGAIIPGPARILAGYDYIELLTADFSTLYQDRAALTPVTAVGQQVLAIKDRSRGLIFSQSVGSSAVATVEADDQGNLFLTTATPTGAGFELATSSTFTSPFFAAISAESPAGVPPQIGYAIASNHRFDILGTSAFRQSARIINPALGSKVAPTATATIAPGVRFVSDAYLAAEVISSRWNGGAKIDVAATGYATGWQLAGAKPAIFLPVSSRFYGGLLSHGAALTEVQRGAVADYFKYRSGIRTLEKNEYDVFGLAGQSNCSGQGDYTLSTVVPWGQGAEYLVGAIRSIGDPTKHYAASVTAAGNYSDTGSAWPAFAKKYFELTGRRALICGGGASGVGTAGWVSSGDLRGNLADKMLEAKAFIESKGGTAKLAGIIHLGGETDATTGLSGAATQTNIATIHASLKTLTSTTNLPMYIMSVDRTTNPAQDAAFAVTRQALIDAAIAGEDRYHIMPYQDFVGQAKMEDNIHWDQVALNEAGEIAATNLAAIL